MKDGPGRVRMPDDAALVRAAVRGDEDAFAALVERYSGMASALAYAVTGDAEASRDIAQDAFHEAYRSLRRLRSAAKFAPWLAGMVRRKAISWVRRRGRSRVEAAGAGGELSAEAGADSPSEQAEKEETRGRVLRAVRGLPRGYREVLVMRCLEERSYSDIGRVLGLSLAAVDKRLTRAKAMLREALRDLVEEE